MAPSCGSRVVVASSRAGSSLRRATTAAADRPRPPPCSGSSSAVSTASITSSPRARCPPLARCTRSAPSPSTLILQIVHTPHHSVRPRPAGRRREAAGQALRAVPGNAPRAALPLCLRAASSHRIISSHHIASSHLIT
jgi:hypothetical protein